MKSKILTVTIFLLLLTSYCFPQDQKLIDSLTIALGKQEDNKEKVKTLEELFYAYIYSEPKKAKPYIENALKLSKKINDRQSEAVSLYNIGTYHHVAMEVDSARHYYYLSDAILTELDDKERIGTVVSSLGKLEHIEGNYEAALKQFEKALSIAKVLNKPLHIGNRLVSIGAIHMDKGNFKVALEKTQEAVKVLDTISSEPWRKADALKQLGRIEYLSGNYKASLDSYDEALKIYIDSNDNVWEGHTLCDIGNSYQSLKDYDKAINYYTKSLEIGEKFKVTNLQANSLGNIGQVFSMQKKYAKAIEYISKSNKLNKESNSINNFIASFNQLGEAYHGNKEYNKALFNYNKAIKLSDSIGLIEQLKNGYHNRSETYESLGMLKKAINDKKNFIKLKDSMFNKEKSQQFAELRTQFETERKEQEIILQKNEIDLLEQKANVSRLQKLLLGSGLVLSLTAIGFGYYGFRQRIKRNKVEKDKLDNELAFKKKELTTYALNLARKNEVLEGLKEKAEELKKQQSQDGYQHLIRTIDFDLQDDNNWENFSNYFQQVHKDFNSKIKQQYPSISASELRFLSLVKMNLSSKEIASILNISNEGIKKARYRVRKKLNLSPEDSLEDLILSI